MQASASRLARRVFLSAFSMAVLAVPAWAETAAAPKVVFKTTLGEFVVEVYPDKAPKTVENFLRYVKVQLQKRQSNITARVCKTKDSRSKY